MDKQVIEVIESYKKSLSETLENSGYHIADFSENGYDGVCIIEDECAYFFEFGEPGIVLHNNGTNDKFTGISMLISKRISMPRLNKTQRIDLMESLEDNYSIMMNHEYGDNYILKIHRVFLDNDNMIANAFDAFARLLKSENVINDFIYNNDLW